MILCLVLIATVFVVIAPFNVSAAILHVGPGQTYSAIQDAINAASPGDTIFIHESTYYEHIGVHKSLTLQGENRAKTIIHGSDTGDVVFIVSPFVTISNLTITNGDNGIITNTSDNTISENSIINHEDNAIYLLYSSDTTITNNDIYNNSRGLNFDTSSNNLISNNNITDNNYGMFLYSGSNNNLISTNSISNNEYGIILSSSSSNSISNNEIYANQII
jgi:parallel beta-helix repeat protein